VARRGAPYPGVARGEPGRALTCGQQAPPALPGAHAAQARHAVLQRRGERLSANLWRAAAACRCVSKAGRLLSPAARRGKEARAAARAEGACRGVGRVRAGAHRRRRRQRAWQGRPKAAPAERGAPSWAAPPKTAAKTQAAPRGPAAAPPARREAPHQRPQARTGRAVPPAVNAGQPARGQASCRRATQPPRSTAACACGTPLGAHLRHLIALCAASLSLASFLGRAHRGERRAKRAPRAPGGSRTADAPRRVRAKR
jgi:hypothetical protein